jgi:chromosome segregation ATPase
MRVVTEKSWVGLVKERDDLRQKLDDADHTLKATEDAYHALRIEADTLRPQLTAMTHERDSALAACAAKDEALRNWSTAHQAREELGDAREETEKALAIDCGKDFLAEFLKIREALSKIANDTDDCVSPGIKTMVEKTLRGAE